MLKVEIMSKTENDVTSRYETSLNRMKVFECCRIGGAVLDDAKIVELFLCRDETAITATAEKYGGRLRYLANNLLDDIYAAEECENDTYLAAWKAIPPHTPFTYLYPFLARITRHIALDQCRKRSRLKRNLHLVELTKEMEMCIPIRNDLDSRINAQLLGTTINGFLRSISQEKRNIFLRRYWYLDSVSAIADKFSISESKVKTTLYRTRKELQKYLKKEGIIE